MVLEDHAQPLDNRRPDDASYRIALEPLPAGTARIEVRAHEGSHPSSS